MDDEEHERRRQERGEQMAVVRQSFLDDVATSPSRSRLRDLTDADHKKIEALLGSWLEGVLLGRRMKECKLRLFLTSGRLLNQAEVGSENPNRPPELERSVWTIDTMDDADLPIYGYVASLGDVRDPEGGGLTRKTLPTPTARHGSSTSPGCDHDRRSPQGTASGCFISGARRQAPFTAPSWVSVPPEAGDYICVRTHADFCIATDFIECQTLGGVYVEDIERIIFDDEPEAATREALGDRIPWSVAGPP